MKFYHMNDMRALTVKSDASGDRVHYTSDGDSSL